MGWESNLELSWKKLVTTAMLATRTYVTVNGAVNKTWCTTSTEQARHAGADAFLLPATLLYTLAELASVDMYTMTQR